MAKEVWSLRRKDLLNGMLHRPIISEGLPCQEVIEMPEVMVVNGREVGRICWMRKGFIFQLMESLHHPLCDMWASIVVQHEDIMSVDHCWMLVEKFVVHFMEFSTVTICIDGFTSPEKDMMDHTHHRPPYQQQHLPWVERWFRKQPWTLITIQPLS